MKFRTETLYVIALACRSAELTGYEVVDPNKDDTEFLGLSLRDSAATSVELIALLLRGM